MIGSGTDWQVFRQAREQSQCGEGRVAEHGKPFGKPCPLTPLPVLVPPSVFDEMEFVFHAPMTSAQLHQTLRTHLLAGNGRDLVVGLAADRDPSGNDLRVNPENQLDAVEVDRITDVCDLLAFDDPKFAAMNFAPFLSAVSASGGRISASWKLV